MRINEMNDHPRPSRMSGAGLHAFRVALGDSRSRLRDLSTAAYHVGAVNDSESFDSVIRKLTRYIDFVDDEISRRDLWPQSVEEAA